MERFSQSPGVRAWMGGEISAVRRIAAAFLLLMAWVFGILALARPQWGTYMENVVRRGVDVIVAVDTSLSMDTADVPPTRLGKAKEELAALLEKMPDARVGIISFAGSAILQCPLTLDRGAAAMFLDVLETGDTPDPGTNLENAVQVAERAFARGSRKDRVLVLITDGENLEGNPVEAAARAASSGIIIHAIGVGTPGGQPIPITGDGGQVVGYKTDGDGNPVVSRLDESGLSRMARAGGGRYFRSTPGETEVDALSSEIQGLEKKELQSRKVRRYQDRFPIFLAVSLACLFLESILSDRRGALVAAFRRLGALLARRVVRRGAAS